MADTAEKIQNMNIQDFDGSDFDPYSPASNKMESVQNGEQTKGVDLLGGFNEQGQVNGTGKHVSFDPDAGIGLPDPSYVSQGQGQTGNQFERHMSEGEILGYQNEYGEMSSHQGEYQVNSDEEDQNNLVNFEGTDLDRVAHQGQGHSNSGEYSSPERDSSQNDYDQYVENDYVEENPSGVQVNKEYVEEAFDGGYENDDIDPENWQPEMDPERLRRSLSPERSVSPMVRHNESNVEHDSVSEVSQHQAVGGLSEASTIPVSPDYDNTESADLVSQSSQMMSETESLDSRSECEGTPRRRRIPKPKSKKPAALPPWDDNVVIPPLPRMKPTLIGKQADVAPMSPPPRLQRPRTAPARHSAKDASSDSGVEEDKGSMRQNSADSKRKYGTDTKNERYKPGGGNIQVFHQKIDTKYVAPRTDTTKPRSALMSPRISPSKEKASTPKPPTPNTKAVQSKIGSLNNMKHTPGGGNIKVLNAKVDFSAVSSKVGSKDKIHHQPKGGDKKIESRKLMWQTDSRVGSLKNVTHSPGGGNVKVCVAEVHETMNTEMDMSRVPDDNVTKQRLSWSAHSRVGSLDNYTHSPGGGNIKILDQKVEIKAQSKVGSTANLKHKPGGGDKKIETQKLEFKDSARSKVGSMDKVKHKPGGGDIKIYNESMKWDTSSRVKSLDNATHTPGGGNVKIKDEMPVWKVSSRVESLVNADHIPGGGKVKIVDEKPVWTAASKVESLINADHVPGGGHVKISSARLNWRAVAKVHSVRNIQHKPAGGNVKILDEKVDFTGTAKSKVGSMDKVKHQPGGGDKKIRWVVESANARIKSFKYLDKVLPTSQVPFIGDYVRIVCAIANLYLPKLKSNQDGDTELANTMIERSKQIETQKLTFKESAKARTDTGGSSGEKLGNSRSASVTSSQEGSVQD